MYGFTITTAHVLAGGGGIDPGVSPDMSAPWIQNFLQTFAGQMVGTAIVAFVITGVLGLLVFGGSKVFGASTGQSIGIQGFLWSIGGALLVGSIAGAIAWFSGWQIF